MRQIRRRSFVPIDEQPKRPRRIIVRRSQSVVGTYTLRGQSAAWFTSEIASPPTGYLPMVPLGYVMALDPSSLMVVPHDVAQGYGPVGVLGADAIFDWNYGTLEVPVIMRGDVIEKGCWDNHQFGVVLQETKDKLGDRIKFI